MDISPLFPIFALIVVAGFCAVIKLLIEDKLRKNRTKSKVTQGRGRSDDDDDEPDVFPYISCGSILTPTELTFFNALVPVINGHWHIFTKVRLEDIINVKSGLERKVAYGYRSRIKSRHVDFILCDKETLEILMCIELDDSSHQSAKAKETDAFKDKAFKDAGLTLIRIPARRSYPEHVLKQAIFEIDPEELIPQTQEAAVSPATNEDPHARWKPASMSK